MDSHVTFYNILLFSGRSLITDAKSCGRLILYNFLAFLLKISRSSLKYSRTQLNDPQKDEYKLTTG